jgi:hypothetical protein
MIYKCEHCNFSSEIFQETEKHEAEHFGLTVAEFHQWNSLKADVESAGRTISHSKNEFTERFFDNAIHKLLAFEKDHELKNR